MRPDRIIIGECRGPEALDMLQAMNTGHDGSLTTIHANDTRDALSRLEMMVGMAGFDLPIWIIRRQIASAIHIVVQVARLPGGVRKMVKISEITGMEGDIISMHDVFGFKQTGVDDEPEAQGYFSRHRDPARSAWSGWRSPARACRRRCSSGVFFRGERVRRLAAVRRTARIYDPPLNHNLPGTPSEEMTVNPTLMTLLAFLAGACAVAGVYSILTDLFLRDRSRVDRRLQEAFRLREREKVRQAPLFKDFEDLKFRTEALDLGDAGWRERLESMVQQSGLNVTLSRLLTLAAGLGLGLGAVAGLLSQSPLTGIIVGLAGVCGPLVYVRTKQKTRLKKLLAQLPDAFDLMARVIRAGQTMSQALQAIADEFDEPIAGEFVYCYEQQNMGLAPEFALRDLARRTGLLEVKIFVLAVLVQQQTGGNLAELLERLAAIVRERFRMREKINALTAEGRMQAVILLAMVPLMFLLLLILNRSYAVVLFERPALLIGMVIAEVAGAIWIRRIVNFDF